MTCRCHSYNRPSPDQTRPAVVLRMPDALFARSGFANQVKSIDACISDAVAALWAAGILTGGSCCGHGGLFGESRPQALLMESEDPARAIEVLRSVDDREWQVLQWRLCEVFDYRQAGDPFPAVRPARLTTPSSTRPAPHADPGDAHDA